MPLKQLLSRSLMTPALLKAVDNFQVSSYFDLSAAFDTVSHLLFLNIHPSLGFSDTTFFWFTSFLTDFPSPSSLLISPFSLTLNIGVNKGSFLGPLLYTNPLRDLMQSQAINVISRSMIPRYIYISSIQTSLPTSILLYTTACSTSPLKCILGISDQTEIQFQSQTPLLPTAFHMSIDGNSLSQLYRPKPWSHRIQVNSFPFTMLSPFVSFYHGFKNFFSRGLLGTKFEQA